MGNRVPHLFQRHHRRLDDIDRIVRSVGLRKHVPDACRFHDGAYSAAGYDARPGRRRHQQDFGRPVLGHHLVRNRRLFQRDGVHVLLCGLIGPETAGWFREPINSLDDLRGLKIRFAGLGGKVIERTGASVTMIPGAEIFQALEKGAIDATEYSLPNVDQSLGFDRVAKLNYFPGWHQVFTAIHLTVNLDEWQNLTPQHQSILETACTAGVTRNLAKAEAVQGPIIAGFTEKGVTANYLPEDVLRELNRLSDEVMAEESANDADFKRIYESQNAFRADYAHWKKFAYLPRDF